MFNHSKTPMARQEQTSPCLLLLPPPFRYLMTEAEVADMIGYSVSTLRTRRSRGVSANEMPMPRHIKVGGKIMYRGHEVYEYMLEHEMLDHDERPAYTKEVIALASKVLTFGNLPSERDADGRVLS